MTDYLNKLWAEKIIDTLILKGINYFCVSPGSRSTPLTMAIANHPRAESIILLDERGAGYHAVGYAKGARKPAVLVCTSGTAAANYLPAIVEANNDSVPLIVLTADRPPELQNIGVNQTINQQDLFRPYLRYFNNFEPPESEGEFDDKIDSLIDGINKSQLGPIHFNCMIREPLYPEIRSGNNEELNFSDLGEYFNERNDLNDDDVERIATLINKSSSGLILLGRGFELVNKNVLFDLFDKLKFPVFPDIQSGYRFADNQYIVNYYDQILNSDQIFKKDYDVAIQIGYGITSKRLLKYLQDNEINNFIQLIETDNIHDPERVVTDRIECNIEHSLNTLLPLIHNKNEYNHIKEYQSANLICDEVILENFTELNEISVARSISELIPEGNGLFLASSMPIREVDMYGAVNNKRISISANRGASGIDGVISSAVGFSNGLQKPVTLLTGDLSFMHDLNGLLSLKQSDNQLIIIIVNNDGGGIFSFLPISKNNAQFEEYFGTPHGLDFSDTVKQFGIEYSNPTNLETFKAAYKEAIQSGNHAVIELKTNRAENYSSHQEMTTLIINALEELSE